ncbi:hypothetical protein Cri9333_0793 [Crinalium epipsammum PCC 9333]|uniref:DUF4349 domain-containing protein n=2 Tax=Crinalium TaxID=241421 RepID=K9VW52_9CYAN|nr:hypothetical protein Cri9333_0793 [Crinalium epipsammum PCC 9333]
MNRLISAKFKPSLASCAILGTIVLTSCASAADKTGQAPMSAPLPQEAAESSADVGGGSNMALDTAKTAPIQGRAAKAQAPVSRSQLVKKAELALRVNSIDKSIRTVSQLIQKQQGDLLSLESNKPYQQNSGQTATMQMRVPQAKLESSLDSIAQLGTVERRTLTAEDVSNQLVDNAARLRNFRKQESTLLKIMERAGSIPNVLQVSNELSQVRQSIEQLDAQLKSLRNQVAYSTITLSLEEAIATTLPERALGLQVQESWNQATYSVGALTTNLLKLGIWLIAYSPYLLLLTGAAWFGYTRFHQRHSQLPETRNSD